jgi:hypothetical protein
VLCVVNTGAAQGWIRRWPNAGKLGNELQGWTAKLSVGGSELSKTGLFRNYDAIRSFLSFYRKFDFLEPPEIGKYGIRDIHRGGENIKPLRQQLKDAIKVVADRRRRRGKHSEAEEIMTLLPRGVEAQSTGADRFEAPSGCSLAESVEYLRKQSAEMKFDIDTIKKQAEEILEVPSHTRMLSAPLVSQCH